MTAGPVRSLCLAGMALALSSCARSESAEGSADPFAASIARQDRDQADATLRRQAAGSEQANAQQAETRRKAD